MTHHHQLSADTLPFLSFPSLPLFDSWHGLCAAICFRGKICNPFDDRCLVFNALFWLTLQHSHWRTFYFIYDRPVVTFYFLPLTNTAVRLMEKRKIRRKSSSSVVRRWTVSIFAFRVMPPPPPPFPPPPRTNKRQTSSHRKCGRYFYPTFADNPGPRSRHSLKEILHKVGNGK